MAKTRKGRRRKNRKKRGQNSKRQRCLSLPHELLPSILSYLFFVERSKLRGICRSFKSAIDSLPGLFWLDVRLVCHSGDDDYERSHVVVAADQVFPDKVQMDLHLLGNAPSEEDVSMILPCLRTVRPAILGVMSSDGVGDERAFVHASVLWRVARDIVGGLRNLSVYRLEPDYSLSLDHLFSRFDGVPQITLEVREPIVSALSAVAHLGADLVQLDVTLSPIGDEWDEYPDTTEHHFDNLASLTNLEKLHINVSFDRNREWSRLDAFHFMNGCPTLPQVKVLELGLCFYYNGIYRVPGGVQQFVSMLRDRFVKLEELSDIYDPKVELWEELHNVGGHQSLRKLAVSFFLNPSHQQLEALALACERDLPSLVCLRLSFPCVDHFTLGEPLSPREIAQSLAGIKYHASLSTIFCRHDEIVRELGAVLGDSIDVVSRSALYGWE